MCIIMKIFNLKISYSTDKDIGNNYNIVILYIVPSFTRIPVPSIYDSNNSLKSL
jgi:hypothetical protein